MQDRGNITVGQRGANSQRSLVIEDTYKDYAGETVYQRGYDNGDGSFSLSLAYLGTEATLNENGSHFAPPSLGQELGGITSNVTSSMYSGLPSEIPSSEYEQVKLAFDLYHKYKFGSIRTYCNSMTHIAMDGMTHEVGKSAGKRGDYYKRWFDKHFFENLQIENHVKNIFLNMFVCNNAFAWTRNVPYNAKYFKDLQEIPVKELREKASMLGKEVAVIKSGEECFAVYNKDKKTFLIEEEVKEYAAKKKSWSKKKITGIVTTLCPTCISVQQDTNKIDGRVYKVTLKDTLSNLYQRDTNARKEDGTGKDYFGFSGDMVCLDLPVDEITHLSVIREDWQEYGGPDTLSALEPINRKMRKILAEDKAVDKMIRYIVLVTVGDKDTPATKKQLMAAASLFKQGQVFTVVWNHTMSIKIISPSGLAEMMKPETFTEMDNDIWEALGFPIFLSGRESNTTFAMATYLLRPLVHKIWTARRAVLQQYLLPLYHYTQNEMGFPKDCISPTFNRYILEDHNRLGSRILSYFKSNLISGDRAYTSLPDNFGEWSDEIERLKKQSPYIKSGVLGSGGKAKEEVGRPDGSKSETPVTKSNTSPKGDGDRPDQDNPRNKKIAEIMDDVLDNM